MPPGGGFIPPFAGVGLSPHRGGFIPRFGHWGGFITPLGWFYPPFLVILSPYWPGGGGVGRSQCEPGNSVPEDRQTHSALFSLLCFRLFCFALLCTTPPPPCLGTALCKNRPLVPQSNAHTTFFTSGYWVFHGCGGCRTAIQVCRTSFHVCCYGSPLSVTDRRTYPLNPSSLLSTPSPKQPAPTRNKQKSVKHRGPLTAPLCKFIFSFLANHPFLVKQVLFDGWVPGQAGFTFLPTWGERRGRPGTQGVRESRVGYKNINL